MRLDFCRMLSPFIVAQMFTSALVATGLSLAAFADDNLPRRVSIGTQVQPVSETTQQRLKLRNTRGVEVVSVLPNTTAESCGILPGDVLLALGDQSIANVPAFVEAVGNLREGKEIEIRINREGVDQKVTASPKGLPQETSNEFNIEYGYITIPNGRLRTVLTLPKDAENAPAVLLLSGLGNGPAEHPSADPIGMKAIAYALTRSGFAVMRVDKPGCGDSEAGPSRDADFKSVVDGYIAGLRKLKQDTRINPKRTMLFGFSIGGVQAPLVAAAEPVSGIAIYGAMSCNWQEYLQSTTRRQLLLAGASYGETEQVVGQQSAGWHYLIYEAKSPDDIASEHTELIDWVDKNWVDGKYFSGVSYRFFQQLGKENVLAAWEKFDGKVLSLWGELDVVTSKSDHELVAEIANRNNTQHGTFQSIPGVDHNLRMLPQQANDKPSAPVAPPAIIDTFINWTKTI